MSEIMPVPNWFKDTLNNLINSLDDGSNIEAPAKSRQIYMSSNNIPGPGERKKSLNKEKNLLKNRSQGHQQCHNTLLFFFAAQQGGGKVRGKEMNMNKGSCFAGKKKAVI